MNYRFLFALSFFLCVQQSVKANFVFDQNCIAAYRAIFDLRFNDARKYIRDERAKSPQNGIPILLDNYIDYLYLLTTENKSQYDKFKDNKSDRIDALEDNDENSPYYLFTQAEVYLQSGMVKARFGDYISSTRDFKKAQNLLTENEEKFRGFLPNQKSLGLIDVIFGAIPSNMKAMANFLGIRGNITTGLKRIEQFRNSIANGPYSYYNDETVFLLCLTHVDVVHDRNSYSYLSPLIETMNDKSTLKSYLQGYICFKTGHADEAIKNILGAPRATQYVAIPIMDYLLGNAKLCRMDTDANIYLTKFLNETQSPNYIKDTYLKLAYYYLLRNNTAKYNYYLALVRTKGYTTDEKDKQALKEANDIKPDIALLKARFYFDGGYYSDALAQLKTIQLNDLNNSRDKIELYYRFGRTYDMMNNFDGAFTNYQRAISMGRNENYYFAANAALNLGVIFEQRKDYKKAADFYNTALQVKSHEYQNSIDTQAKEGLSRLGR
ncbi:MAG: tetratricopeptide repeat protein [Mucilaginibacter sp.]